ncbi:MAG: carbohydrate ABC transporter permease [Thermomicrobiales bacterium]
MHQSSAVHTADADVAQGGVSAQRRTLGRGLILTASAVTLAALGLQLAKTIGWTETGFENWRPVALAVLGWAVALNVGLVLARGPRGERAIFLLPAVLLTLAFVIFPTMFAVYVAFTDWNLSAVAGRQFNGLDNFRRLVHDVNFWQSMRNMAFYVAAVLVQYVIAFGLALLLNQNIRGRKFFRVVFLLPFMLSPVAVSFMIGRSILDPQYGPVVDLLSKFGIENVSFYGDKWPARINIVAMDAWYSIPFVMVLLLAGLQAIPHEVMESAKIDGAAAWETFSHMIFPLMLPVSLTAIVLRIIFELKLIDVVRVVTGGGPGGATDTVTLFVFREGIEKTNVGYATALSQFYLICVIVLVAVILTVAGRWVRRFS